MKSSISLLLFLLFLSGQVHARESSQIKEFALDEHSVYSIPVSHTRVTTISFPGPISAIDGALVSVDSKTPGLFQIAHSKGSHFFSVRALAKKAVTNINVRWNKKTYVFELIESAQPFYSVILHLPPESKQSEQPIPVTPNRLLSILDKAKAFPLLKLHHPETVSKVDFVAYSKDLKVMDYIDYQIHIEEIFRFNPEDTLVFHVLLRNKTDRPIHYRSNGFSVRIGNRTYFQSISDASGVIPPQSDATAYFAITGTPNGGRNELSLKNDFTVLIARLPDAPEPKASASTNSTETVHESTQPD